MLKIVRVPAFKDNYLWILRGSRHAAAVDPGDAGPVQEYLDRERLALCAIPATRHHLGRQRARIAYYRPGDERAINPFPRCGERAEIAAATAPHGERPDDPVPVFAAIREWKNRF